MLTADEIEDGLRLYADMIETTPLEASMADLRQEIAQVRACIAKMHVAMLALRQVMEMSDASN